MLGLSAHARKRMRARGILEAEIEEALDNITYQRPSDDAPDERIIVFGTTQSSRRLKVIVESDDQRYIISVMDQDSDG